MTQRSDPDPEAGSSPGDTAKGWGQKRLSCHSRHVGKGDGMGAPGSGRPASTAPNRLSSKRSRAVLLQITSQMDSAPGKG